MPTPIMLAVDDDPDVLRTVERDLLAVHGEEKLEAISIACARSGSVDRVPARALFVFIGAAPRTNWLDGLTERDERGFILTGANVMRQENRPAGWTADRVRSC